MRLRRVLGRDRRRGPGVRRIRHQERVRPFEHTRLYCPVISRARSAAPYTLLRDSRIAPLWTATARLFRSSNQKAPPSEWMLPSKIRPTISPLRLIIGLPELPPMMSLLVTKSNRCPGFSLLFAACHEAGNANGSTPVSRAKAPAKSVKGGIFLPPSSQPFTSPYDSRNVKVASG